jgi:hypothetical protein
MMDLFISIASSIKVMGISDQYTKEIKRELSYSATWYPENHLSVGDVGMFERGQVHLVGTLKEYGIPFSVRTAPPGRQFNYTSRGAVSIKVKAAGQAELPGVSIGEAEAGVSVKFNSENAILFNTTNTQLSVIENMGTVAKEIKKKREENEWDKKHFVISECLTAGGTTIIISNSRDSQIDFTARGNLNVANLNLADLNLNLNATNKLDITYEYTAKENFTPLFEAWGFKFWSDKPAPLGVRAQKAQRKVEEFKRVDYDDYTAGRARSFRRKSYKEETRQQ